MFGSEYFLAATPGQPAQPDKMPPGART
jgi:hypothetical protein